MESSTARGDFTVGVVDRSGEMGNFLAGELDELAIYSRTLSEKELAGMTKNPGNDATRETN
ncbi:MAG: hypothetical protein KDM63_00045 [Verrucomicrobiae bacterium]|nr:hypothetical protein [Verrucomicrobiae bacterium]MCB1085405.1 hypothetical protein [Verrucomicrobiae bacterium]MCB1089959.1 hypothetical protein [Verrucomicrobiae bacterium]